MLVFIRVVDYFKNNLKNIRKLKNKYYICTNILVKQYATNNPTNRQGFSKS